MIRFLTVSALLGLVSCARREVVPPPSDVTQDVAAQHNSAITLERTACFGTCPVYTISVSRSGEVRYEGKAHVRRTGVANGRIPQGRVDTLLSQIEQAGYFNLADRYESPEPACGRASTDAPTVITSVTVRGRTKRITHYYGCSSVPGVLTILEQKIDDALSSSQWTGH